MKSITVFHDNLSSGFVSTVEMFRAGLPDLVVMDFTSGLSPTEFGAALAVLVSEGG